MKIDGCEKCKMGNKSYPEVEIKPISVFLEDVESCFPATIIKRGNSFYLRLDLEIIRFWQLQSGDTVLTKLVKVKRVNLEDE